MAAEGEPASKIEKEDVIEELPVYKPCPSKNTEYKSGVLSIKWIDGVYKCQECSAKNIGVFKVF